jgi:hypothetical protein
MNSRRAAALLRLISFLILALSAITVLLAQAPTGIISGTVTDQSGGVVPNANITVTDKGAGTARTMTTNSAGLYSAPALLAGNMRFGPRRPASQLWFVRLP